MSFLKKYKFGFDFCAVALFVAIMIPNITWGIFPPENDILTAQPRVFILDIIQSIFQILMLCSLSFIIIKEKPPVKKPFIIGAFVAVVMYYICWVLLYCNIVNPAVILGLCIFPCVGFILFSVSKRNFIALIFAVTFAGLHLTNSIINFL